MSYEKLNLQDGDTLKGEHMGHIEEGIEEAANSLGFNAGYVDGDGFLHFTKDGKDVLGFEPIFVGSGGGSTNNAFLKLTNTTAWLSTTVVAGSDCTITINWQSTEGGLPTGNGVLLVTINGVQRISRNVSQGDVEVKVGPHLTAGANAIVVRITDGYGNSKFINYSVNSVSLTLTSKFDAGMPYTGDITYTYTPTGAAKKLVEFWLDGKRLGTAEVTTSGRQQAYVIPAQAHGSHHLEVFFTAEIDGQNVPSNHLHYDLICLENGNTTPIIASAFLDTEIHQYETVRIPYRVYDPSNMVASITMKVHGVETAALTVDRTEQYWSWRGDQQGAAVLQIICGDTVKTFNIMVTKSQMDVEAETQGLELYLSSYGRSNNEANPGIWEYGSIAAQFQGFNFVSDGWHTDEEGITLLRVTGDARLTIPLQIFATDFRTTGKTIELEFATRDVLNYGTPVISCFSNGRGIQLTPQTVIFQSGQTRMDAQYKENEHLRISFVVEKRSENRLIYFYINGVMSGVVQYPDDDDFSQTPAVGITIGSNEAVTDLYCIRVYNSDLTRFQVLDNYIADTQDIDKMMSIYQRNQVFDEYGQIVIANLPKDLPYLILEGKELPQSKGDKKTISGTYVDPTNTSNSFTFTDASIDVQGTSSQYYARKNYKIKFKNFIKSGRVYDTYQLRTDSIPTSTFTFKADVASSEGANNVELARLYNDVCPSKTPPQESDNRVRLGIDGFPIVVFWNNGVETTFLGKYNFNNDKGTPEVFGFSAGDESWEIKNNTSNRVLWKNPDFSGSDWKNDFEARYPEDSVNVERLRDLAEWLASTDQTQATNGTISPVTYGDVTYTVDSPECRLAKFKEELHEHFDVDSTLFFYLFTELFLMVDNRAKNAFPTLYYKDGKWCWLPYDFDTAIGTNNEGALVFGYELEDIDYTNTGADVFNGQQSVIWVNLRQAFFHELMAMYQKLRSDGLLSFSDTEKRFADHQAKWPEAIFNEDSYFKYLAPLIDEGSGAYLTMLQGSKAAQRKWWLYNRFRYIDSKYNAGDAQSDIITIRGYAKSNITITPYANIYASIKYGSYLVQTRALRGGSYLLECPLDNVNDTEIYIYSASQLADVGDLSGFKVGYAEFSLATKLQGLKLGDGSASYSNYNLTELYLGNNRLLRTLDVRNCPNLAQSVDISGCTNIEEVYFDGTSITGLTLPNGGILKKLHLPGTITNLTIRNQPSLTEFVLPSYGSITTLRLENAGVVDPLEILADIPANSRVRIIGFTYNAETFEDFVWVLNKLDTMRGLDENGNNVDKAQVSGNVHIGSLYKNQLERIQNSYPSITVTYDTMLEYIAYALIKRTLSGHYENNRVKNVGTNAFAGCFGITSVYFGAAERLHNGAFSQVGSLERADLRCVTRIGDQVFYYCSKLTTLILRADSVCVLDHTRGVSPTPISKGTGYIYVPAALVDSYKTATNWSTFAAQFRAIEDYPDICGGEA